MASVCPTPTGLPGVRCKRLLGLAPVHGADPSHPTPDGRGLTPRDQAWRPRGRAALAGRSWSLAVCARGRSRSYGVAHRGRVAWRGLLAVPASGGARPSRRGAVAPPCRGGLLVPPQPGTRPRRCDLPRARCGDVPCPAPACRRAPSRRPGGGRHGRASWRAWPPLACPRLTPPPPARAGARHGPPTRPVGGPGAPWGSGGGGAPPGGRPQRGTPACAPAAGRCWAPGTRVGGRRRLLWDVGRTHQETSSRSRVGSWPSRAARRPRGVSTPGGRWSWGSRAAAGRRSPGLAHVVSWPAAFAGLRVLVFFPRARRA